LNESRRRVNSTVRRRRSYKEQVNRTRCLNSVAISKVSKAVRRLLLLFTLLLGCGIGSCYIGQRQWERELHESERQMRASGFYISDDPGPDTNNWQIAGAATLLVGVSVAIAAVMLWRHDNS
jgi:hypothetical protein